LEGLFIIVGEHPRGLSPSSTHGFTGVFHNTSLNYQHNILIKLRFVIVSPLRVSFLHIFLQHLFCPEKFLPFAVNLIHQFVPIHDGFPFCFLRISPLPKLCLLESFTCVSRVGERRAGWEGVEQQTISTP
jgi:hypothetical protein